MSEFVPMSPTSIFAVFGAGFMLAEAMEDFHHGLPSAGEAILAIMFLILARPDKHVMRSGIYRRGLFVWRRDP